MLLVLLVQQDLQVSRALPVLQVQLVLLVQQDQPVLLVLLAQQDQLVLLVLVVLLV